MLGALFAAGVAAAVGPAPALPPVVYQAATLDYDVRLRIAPELKALPGAYTALQAATVADLRTFECGAVSDMEGIRRRMPGSVMAKMPEIARVEVDFVTRTPHLIAFIQREYMDSHGAHPNAQIAGLLFDLPSGRRLAATDLLRTDVDKAPLNKALWEAMYAAKAKRSVTPETTYGFVKPGQLTWAGEVDLTASHDLLAAFQTGDHPARRNDAPVVATLTASADGERAGGVQFLYSPYDIGSYAEYAYRIVLPWRVFADALKTEYRADFAGAPAGDLADDPLADFPADIPAAEK